MLLFLLGMITGAILIVVIAVVTVKSDHRPANDYKIGYDDGYQEGLHDARWKGADNE
jgi:hypothetical protein